MDAIAQSNSLTDLAARIRAEHEACDAALKLGLQHAVAAGKMLIEAKEQLKHGEWLPWLREHCSLSERKAQRYMRIAPHVCKSDTLSDLPPDQMTWEFAERILDRPFCESDFAAHDLHWLKVKLMHHAGAPAAPAAFLAAEPEIEGYPLLRLCTFDDLEAVAKAVVPLASEKAPFRIERNSMADVLESIETLKALSMWLLGKLLIEIKYRFDLPDDDGERYRKEWHETKAAWMALLEARLAAQTKPPEDA